MATSAIKFESPSFYHRQYSNDIKTDDNDNYWKRAAIVALPFFSLYKPLSFSLSLTLGGLRSVTSIAQLLQNPQCATLLQTTIAIIALGGTLLAHPLGMLITTVHDCAMDCIHMLQYLYMGEFLGALGSYAFLMNNTLYLALFLHGGLHLAVAALAMQLFIGLSQSFSQYRQGNYLEAGGHFLMGMIRGNQLVAQVQLLQINWAQKGNVMHTVAYYLQKPLQYTSELILRAIYTPIRPGIEGNWQSVGAEKINRVATVCLSAVFAPVTISLYAIGEGLHLCGNAINGTPYTYWRGNGEEKLDDQNIKCMTLNACMLWGGLPIPFGGLRPSGERIEELAQLIQSQDPDILFLQEASFPASYELFEKLKDQYAHCYTRIGPNPMRMESGLAVFSKVPIKSAEFLPFPDQKGMYRGAFFIETPSHTFVNTHLQAGDAAEERKKQFDLVTQRIADIKREKNRNTFILGDLNIDSFASDEEYQATIGSHAYHDPRRELHQMTESSTNALDNYMRGKELYSNLSETLDYALLYGDPNEYELQTRLVDTYSVDKPYEALSDHKGLILDIRKI